MNALLVRRNKRISHSDLAYKKGEATELPVKIKDIGEAFQISDAIMHELGTIVGHEFATFEAATAPMGSAIMLYMRAGMEVMKLERDLATRRLPPKEVHARVADQQGVEFEHIVQDSCSDDGTQDWLPHDRRVKAFIEKDGGMYDAVNRGYRRAHRRHPRVSELRRTIPARRAQDRSKFFRAHPEIEVALAGTIVTDGEGKYICHRHSLVPHPRHVWFRFPVLTSSVFIRRRGHSRTRHFFRHALARLRRFALGAGAEKTGCRWLFATTSPPPSPTPAKT